MKTTINLDGWDNDFSILDLVSESISRAPVYQFNCNIYDLVKVQPGDALILRITPKARLGELISMHCKFTRTRGGKTIEVSVPKLLAIRLFNMRYWKHIRSLADVVDSYEKSTVSTIAA